MLTKHTTPCSRCASPDPNPGCCVCGESCHEPEPEQSTHTYHLPKALPNRPAYGLTQADGKWIAHYYKDHVMKQKRLKAATVDDAITERDEFYAHLIEIGATEKPRKPYRRSRPFNAPRNTKTDYGITEMKGFKVVIKGKYHGTFSTYAEALEKRNAVLKKLNLPIPQTTNTEEQ